MVMLAMVPNSKEGFEGSCSGFEGATPPSHFWKLGPPGGSAAAAASHCLNYQVGETGFF